MLRDNASLSGVVHSAKSYSAHRINEVLGRNGSIWQAGFHDHAIRKEETLIDVARYIVANPVRAGLCDRIGEYPHWDCVWI